MKYASTTLATDWDERDLDEWRVKLIKLVLFFMPVANPDIEKLYPRVKKWLLEIGDDGCACREIALDEGRVLFCTPNDRNTGFWTDMAAAKFEDEELIEIPKSDFESVWCGDCGDA